MNRYFTWLIVSIILIPTTIFLNNLSSRIPISYFDEELWVGGSYFYQFYIHRNFDDLIWNNPEASDQPMLTKFVYGAWLYPKFLKNREQDKSIDYTKFLIKNGFYSPYSPNLYKDYKESLGKKFTTLDYGDSGKKNDLVNKYGDSIKNNLNLILFTRKVNVILLILNLLIIFSFFKTIKGDLFSFLIIILYILNPAFIETVLRANTEGIFVFVFNMCLIYLIRTTLRPYKKIDLVLFSIFLGLCFSTKLNGIILFLPYLIITTFEPSSNRVNVLKSTFKLITPIVIAFCIFYIFNPFIFKSPVLNTIRMFLQRSATVKEQAILFPDVVLPGFIERIEFLFRYLFSSYGDWISNPVVKNFLASIVFGLFTIGLIKEVIKALNKNSVSIKILLIFLCVSTVTILYLQLAWDRYLVHILIFFAYYLTVGLTVLYKNLYLGAKSKFVKNV